MSRNCNMPYITSFVTLLSEALVSAGYTYYLGYETDYKMDQDAAPDRLVFLIKVSCQSTKDSCTEHHRELISHVDNEEEQSGHPYRKVLIVFFAGSRDVILDNTLNEDLLQDCADRIEPAHICAEIKTEPGLFCVAGNKRILAQTHYNKTCNEAYADDAGDQEVFLYSLFSGIQAFEMDLELGEDRENECKKKQIAFHHSGEDISVIFYER